MKLELTDKAKIRSRKVLFILFLILANKYVNSQSINDTILKNVVLLQNDNIAQNNDDYLIDAIIDFEKSTNPVVFNDTKLPIRFFKYKLFKSKSFILIRPDWEYYDSVSEEGSRLGECIEPATTNIYYQISSFKNKSKIDSIRKSGNNPKLVFNPIKKHLKSDGNVIFYHTEEFGSTCCLRDQKWDIKEKLDDFITAFEKSNKVKIGGVYKKTTGKEGEHILYFTLSNLNKEQKLDFLQEVRYWTYIDRKLEDIKFEPQIFTPSFIKEEGLKLITKK